MSNPELEKCVDAIKDLLGIIELARRRADCSPAIAEALIKHSRVADAITAIELGRGKSAWTSVETALPDEELIVLFATVGREVWLGCLTDDGWIEMNGDPIDANRVTHWMHMPAHPAELEDKS